MRYARVGNATYFLYYKVWGGRPRPQPAPWPAVGIWLNLTKPGEGARRGSGDPPHQFYAEVGKVCSITHECARHLFERRAVM